MDRPPALPLLAPLGVAAAGLLLTLVDWRSGAVVVGVAVLLAAGLRLALPPRSAGELAVRARPVDVAVLGLLGVALVVLALTIPAV